MIKKRRGFLVSISFLFIFILLILPVKVKAMDNMNICLENIKEGAVLSKDNIDINGYITYDIKLKSIDMYLNNKSLGQATISVEKNIENNTYKIRFEHSCDISKYENGKYILKLVATDENEHKEEKILNVDINKQQNQLVEKENSNDITSIQIPDKQKVLSVPLSGKASIQTYDIMLGNQYITGNKLSSGKTYTIKGYASSINGVLYEFWVKDVSTGTWTKIRDYKEDRYANWTPSKTGQYIIAVNVKDKYSGANVDGRIEKTFTVANIVGKASIQTYDIMLGNQYITGNKLSSGKTYTIKGYASSINGVLYEFWVKDVSTGTWTKIRDYKEDRYANWIPSKTGQYIIAVNVKDKYSGASVDGRIEKTFIIDYKPGKATIQTYDIMLGNQYITSYQLQVGKTYTIKGYASSSNVVLYEFWAKDLNTGSLNKIRDYNGDKCANWTPAKSGRYAIIVNVKDIFSTSNYDTKVEKIFTIFTNISSKKIVIDPGHGGYDSGAVGPTGVKEKDIALKVSLKLGKILEQNGVQVVYTRTSDSVSWPSNESQDLAARTNITNKVNPDLFVSIHNNSYNESSNGTETYYYNGSVKGREAAEAVQKELIKAIGLYNRGVKTGGYYVLKNTISPSILVELAFISNINEEILLNSDWFQQKCAEAIAKGILQTSFMQSNTQDNSKKNYKNSYYNITLDEMVNKQMLDTPAYHTYIPEKNAYEWRYAIIKNEKKGYATDINGSNWIQSNEQYEYIKSKVREYVDPNKQAYDSNGQYQFLQLSYNECTIASELNKVLQGKGVLEGKGQAFIDAGRESNISPIYLVAHALLETGNGTSTLAKGVVVNGKTIYNLFGIRAVDSDPTGQGSKYAYEQGWFSIDLAIKGGAKWISSAYINHTTYKQDTLYKMRWNPANPTVHQYATDIRWAYNQVANIKNVIEGLENSVLNFDIPILA